MTDSDPTKSQLYQREWFYDKLMNDYRRRVEVATEKEKLCRILQDRITPLKNSELLQSAALTVAEEARGDREDYSKWFHDLSQSKIMVIGPSTIESLVNQPPESYEYIMQGKTPFDKIFFELAEPIRMGVPLLNQTKNLRAINLLKLNPGDNRTYVMVAHYSDDPQDLVCMALSLDPEERNIFAGYIFEFSNRLKSEFAFTNNVREALRRGKYRDFNKGAGKYKDLAFRIDVEQRVGQISSKSGIFALEGKVRPEDLSEPQTFLQVPNLCVNLINYINAHNTTVIPRTTPIRRHQAGNHQRENREFYIVTIKDRTVQRYEPREDRLWTLQERIFVRGHNRGYTNAEGIRVTAWIPPYVKGPSDAPFREQRYQVLYDKLQQELQMFRDLGLRQDNEMWMPQ